MEDLKFEKIEGEPKEADKGVMVEGMLAYHASRGHERKVEHFSVTAKDRTGRLAGVVMVTFLWNGMEIGSLWVDEVSRGAGLGRNLMEMAEEEGRRRGCDFAYTNTFSWQAPKFYEKMGYEVYGKLEDFPPGNTLTYYRKNLT